MSATRSTKRPRAARLPPEERRRLLISAGITVFAHRGIGAARQTDVASQAGVSEATVFTYFRTREKMVAAVLDEVARYYRALVTATLEVDGEPLIGRLTNLIDRVSASADDDPDYARVWFNWSSATRADIWPRYLKTEKIIIEELVAAVRGAPKAERAALVDIHPEDLARLLLGVAERIARMKFAGNSQREVRRFIRSAHHLMIRPGSA